MVGCDSCDFWIHDRCDNEAARILSNTRGNAEPYSCPMCRSAQQAKVPATSSALDPVPDVLETSHFPRRHLSLRIGPREECVRV